MELEKLKGEDVSEREKSKISERSNDEMLDIKKLLK